MKKRNIRELVAFICLLLLVFGCRKTVHSPGADKPDNKIDSIEKCMTDSLFINNDFSRSLIRKSMAESGDSLTYYQLMSLYSKACYAAAQYDSVRHYNALVLHFCQNASDSPRVHDLISVVYNLSGVVWTQLNQPDSALSCFLKAYQHRIQGVDITYLPNLCMNLGDGYIHKGDFANGAFYYRRALLLCDSLNLPDRNKFPVYSGLGQVYMEIRDFELSDKYYELTGTYSSQMNPAERFTYLNNRGNHFYYKKDYPKAVIFMDSALSVASSYPQMIFEQNLSKANLGELYMLTGKLDSARLYLDESYRFFTDLNNNTAVYYIETQLIELALKKGNLAEAGRIIDRKYPTGHIDVNMINIRNRYLQHYYERIGDYRKAYDYVKQNLRLDDSLRNEQVRTRVAELDMRYRQDTIVMRRELLIEKQSGEMKALRLTSLIWAIGCIALVTVLFVVYWLMKKKRVYLQERHINQISRLRMENIRNHISPHFTFNVLSREISSFKGTEAECNGLAGLVKLLRKSLELTEKLSVLLCEELDFVQTYINLERDRLGDDFHLTIQVDEVLETDKIIIPSMIIQIPVENAIKHGLASIEGEKKLGIILSHVTTGVKLQIIDNGRGYSPQTISAARGTGTGLKVLYQTIQLLNAKNKGEKIRFEISNLNDDGQTGTCVSVYVPYNYSYDL